MKRETYEVERLLDGGEKLHHERQYRTLEDIELLLDKRMNVLEGQFERHLAKHREIDVGDDPGNVKAAQG